MDASEAVESTDLSAQTSPSCPTWNIDDFVIEDGLDVRPGSEIAITRYPGKHPGIEFVLYLKDDTGRAFEDLDISYSLGFAGSCHVTQNGPIPYVSTRPVFNRGIIRDIAVPSAFYKASVEDVIPSYALVRMAKDGVQLYQRAFLLDEDSMPIDLYVAPSP